MYSISFWKDTFERAVKSAAQGALLAWGVGDQIMNIFEADWGVAGGAALGAMILSILTSIISAPIGSKGDASLVK
jgi:hypothetical protein